MAPRTLNATAGSLLGFLHEGPMSGWDLVVQAQQRIGSFWTLTQSQVYRELSAMARDGLVERGEPGPRERTPYRITDAGRTAFREWVNRDPGLEQIRFPLLLTIMFAGHLPTERLAEIIEAHRGRHSSRLEEYRRTRDQIERDGGPTEVDSYRLATLDFGLRYESAVLDWFDELPKILGSA